MFNPYTAHPGSRTAHLLPSRLAGMSEELSNTEYELNHALRIALKSREPVRELVAHSTRVVILADWLASELEVGDIEFEHLQFAAQLHEIGMITVPVQLLRNPGPLLPEELAQVREQAELGAEIVRAYHSPRTAQIVECQYLDHEVLRDRFGDGSIDLLLIGILRLADVFDTMGHPRAYQRPWTVEERLAEIQAGSGTRYHPAVVEVFLRGWGKHEKSEG